MMYTYSKECERYDLLEFSIFKKQNKGVFLEELVDIIGVPRQTISKWKSGETTPNLQNAVYLKKAEISSDRTTLIFGIAFPIVLLVLLTVIQSNIPVEQFPIDRLTPGISIFGL